MKRSLWILTSCSLALCVGAILFAIFTRIQIPNKNSLKPIFEKELKVKSLKPQEISAIYENDIFDTYVPKLNLDGDLTELGNMGFPITDINLLQKLYITRPDGNKGFWLVDKTTLDNNYEIFTPEEKMEIESDYVLLIKLEHRRLQLEKNMNDIMEELKRRHVNNLKKIE